MWFINRTDAEALLATIPRHLDWNYAVTPHGCGPGYGIMVSNADGIITEAWDGETDLTATIAARREEINKLQRLVPKPEP